MSKNTAVLPDWDRVLSSACRLQQLLPEAVLVGGTAAAIHAEHRLSQDADHVLPDLRRQFDDILAQLESAAGWQTARVTRPSLDGIETGVRQLIRTEPLETTTLQHRNETLTIPTPAEILRIKGVLILKRNATRDYLDFAALSHRIGDQATAEALRPFDRLYQQDNGESALQQLQAQLASPLPYDLEDTELSEYKNLAAQWHDWNEVAAACAHVAVVVFDYVCERSGSG